MKYPDTGALYRLDAVGNRTGERRALASRLSALTVAAFTAIAPADLTHDITAEFNRADWLTARTDAVNPAHNVALLYDANGNTTKKTTAANTRAFAWDCRDTLVSVSDNGVGLGRYDYDRNLQRVKRTAGAETVEYVLDDKFVLQEADGSQTSHPATRRYHYAAQPLAVADGAGLKYLNVDALGSVSDATSTSGVLATVRQYNAWGEYRNGTAPTVAEPKLGYTGHQFDVESGLVYARARYYDPALGIFLSRDGVEGSTSDAPSLHRYAYVKGNPLRWIDFLGFAEGDTTEDSILKAKQGALATKFPNARVLDVPEAEIEKTFEGLQKPLKKSLTQAEQAVVETRDGVVRLTKIFVFVTSLGMAGGASAAAETIAARIGLGRFGTTGLTIGLDAAEGFLFGSGGDVLTQGVELSVDARKEFDPNQSLTSGSYGAGGNVAGQTVMRGLGKVVSRPIDAANLDQEAKELAKWLAQNPVERMIPGTPGVVTGGSSTTLGKNMMSDMGLPRTTKWSGYQAQHVIPSELASHPVLMKVGMDLDNASNGLFLRKPDGMVSTMSRHEGFHSVYNEAVERQLSRMDTSRSVGELEAEVFGLQQRLRELQMSGLPLYPGKSTGGATVDLWERWLKK